MRRFLAWIRHYRRVRWEYETFNSDLLKDWNTMGQEGWEIVQVGWGKATYNVLAKRRIRWFA